MLSDGDITVPSVQLVVAIPLALVVELGGFTVPPPSVTVQPIGTPATGLLNWSITRTASATGSVWPTVSTWASPDSMVIWVAPPTVALTLNVTVLDPPASGAVAVGVCCLAPAPSVRTGLARPWRLGRDRCGCSRPTSDGVAQVPVAGARGPGGKVDGARRDVRQPGTGESQRAGAHRAGDLEIGERRDAGGVGVEGERSAERAVP